MDENIFIPVQQLNLLRRSALEGLKEKLLSGYLRKSGSPLSESGSETSRSGSESRVPSLSIYAESVDQLSAAASCITELHTFPARIYLGTDIQSELMNENGKEQISKILSLFRKNKTEIVIAMPHILRSTEREVTETLLNASDALSPDGILIRNCEELQLLKERGFDKKIILDHNLYVFNRYAKKFWHNLGISEFTAPLELNADELSRLCLNDCEMEIYGRAPVMVSAQCLFKTSGKCTKRSEISCLKDRYSSIFPVRAYCDFCYNVIYNDRPTCLADDMKEIRRLNPALLRIRFSTETPDEVKEILATVPNHFRDSTDTSGSMHYDQRFEFTQGHFRKGIL